MPSANPKLEKQASTEAVDPIRQVITVIEHKIRNLEKRKGKLESYKDIQKNGKELDRDQKTAVAKYDEVLQTLDITRDLYKSIQSISNDNAKAQKKLARKEALERTQQDIAKVKEVLLIQDTLTNMGSDVARDDFLQGTNGATKLSKEDLKTLDDLFNELTLKRQTEAGEPPFAQQVHKAAEHLVAIVDGKQREVIGTTYIKIKEIVTTINQSGYFDQVHEVETAAQEQSAEAPSEARVAGAPAPEQPAEDYSAGEVHIPPPESMIPAPNFPVQVAQLPVVSGPAPVAGPLPVVAQPIPPHPAAPVDASYYVNAAGFVPQSQQSQQQQQQQQQVPPPQQQPQQPPQAQPPQQPQAPRINDVIGTPDFFFLQESELDSPDVTGQSAPIISHIPPAVNAPIPSQTFTNQSFAGAPVQVIYQHPPPPQDMPHIPGFANPNPPPPIPMPPSHQQQNLPYSPQHPAGFQQPQNAQLQPQTYDPSAHQESQQSMEDKIEQGQEVVGSGEQDANEPVDWAQMSEQPLDEWGKTDGHDASGQMSQQQSQQSQQAWGEQRGGYRGRGGRRGNSNGYNSRGRGGGYQQNGRGGAGQGTYYRNDNSNYQNGYQQRSYNNEGSAGYNGGFKRGGGGGGGERGGSRGGPRGERGGMDGRGGRGGQFRGGQRGGNRGGGHVPRGKPQAQQ